MKIFLNTTPQNAVGYIDGQNQNLICFECYKSMREDPDVEIKGERIMLTDIDHVKMFRGEDAEFICEVQISDKCESK